MEWYKVKKNVIELMEFLMDCELMTSKEDVIHFSKYPDTYGEVWTLYQREINGVY
jgi:hypothetical protein